MKYCSNDFKFVKVFQKKIVAVHLSKGKEYSNNEVKRKVGKGLLQKDKIRTSIAYSCF